MSRIPHRYVIGIDPGVTGAIAVFRDGQFFAVHDIPFTAETSKSKKCVDVFALYELLCNLSSYIGVFRYVYLERAQSMPGQGVSSMFSYGQTFGIIMAALAGAGITSRGYKPILVHPARWKRELHLIGNFLPKDADLKKARTLYPLAPLNLQKHHNRADAILIGHYGCLQERLIR